MKELTAYKIIEDLLSKDLCGIDLAKVKSVKSWLDSKGGLTLKQKRMLKAIENKYIHKQIKSEYRLYLISNGEYIEHLGEIPEVRISSIDLDSLTNIRKLLPLLKERRTDLYE